MPSPKWPPASTGRSNRVEREHARSTEIIERMEDGVVVVNTSLTPVIANGPARRLLGIAEGGLPPSLAPDELISIARRSLIDETTVTTTLRVRDYTLRVRAIPLEDGVGIFLHDATEELGTQQLRRQFAANASHELKTPVASLATLVDAIESAIDDDADAAKRFTQRLGVEISRLQALIGDLMDLSRVEDPAAMRIEEVDLSAVVVSQITDIRVPASEKELTLLHDVRPGLRVRGDRQHLELMVRNLLDNAVRYSLHQGTVRVALAGGAGIARLEVRDDGIGIPVQAQARVFERFYRVDEDRARVSGGTGLGLSIVKNVAESHAGTVAVTSELDEGSTFTVTLPLLLGEIG